MIGYNTEVTSDQPWVLLAAFAIGTIAVARVVRLLVDDDFPPTRWMREQYVRRVPEAWAGLVECPWCMAPYVAVTDIGWAWATGLHWTWWFANVWAAVSWLAAYLCARDIPPDQRQ